jgi:hypothetical protein
MDFSQAMDRYGSASLDGVRSISARMGLMGCFPGVICPVTFYGPAPPAIEKYGQGNAV